jgi:hypothetical protein
MSAIKQITDVGELRDRYSELGAEAQAVITWMVRKLNFKTHAIKPLPKGKSIWVFYAPGTGGTYDVVELKREELRWRHVFGLATSYDYEFSVQVRELYNDYVTMQGGHI